MILQNKSKRFSSFILPSEISYSTLLLDVENLQTDIDVSYDKIIVLSDSALHDELEGFLWKFSIGIANSFITLYEKKDLLCNLTFVIQGTIHEHTLYTILYTAPYGSISLGLWDTDLESIKHHVETNNIDNYYNKYFQIVSTLKGLLNVNTEYAIKLRADEYFIHFTPFIYKLYSLQPYQILTSNIHFKKANDWPYHISDHIIGGKTEYLKMMFTKAFHNAEKNMLLNITPEVHLCISYLQHFAVVDPNDKDFQKIISLMSSFFEVFPIRLFEDYKAKAITFVSKRDGPVPGVTTLEGISDFAIPVVKN